MTLKLRMTWHGGKWGGGKKQATTLKVFLLPRGRECAKLNLGNSIPQGRALDLHSQVHLCQILHTLVKERLQHLGFSMIAGHLCSEEFFRQIFRAFKLLKGGQVYGRIFEWFEKKKQWYRSNWKTPNWEKVSENDSIQRIRVGYD